jgi:hypothetical protein
MKWKMSIVVAALLALPVMAADLYVGGTYYDYGTDMPMASSYGGDVQIRQGIGAGFSVGASVGYERGDLRRQSTTVGRWCKFNETFDGSFKSVPLGVSGLYTINLGKANIVGEVGVQYHLMDYDLMETQSISCGKYSCGRQSTDFNPGNIWTAPAALYLEVPMGDVISFSIGGGYRWQLNSYNNGRFMEAPFGKMGLVIKM